MRRAEETRPEALAELGPSGGGGGAGKPEPRGASGTLGGGALLAAAGPLFRWPAESDEPRTGTERKLRPLGLSLAATPIAGAPPSELGTAGWLHQSHSTPFIPLPRTPPSPAGFASLHLRLHLPFFTLLLLPPACCSWDIRP